MAESAPPSGVTVVSAPYLPGMRIERVLGMTWGTVVRARGIGYQVVAGLRSLAGGEIDEYTDMLNTARRHALERMQAHAAAMGANAVIGAAFDSSELGQNMSEVLAYGTAVVAVPEEAATSPVRLA
ncbi:MAG: heavy metal-binding domain-containing protein [Firmicutes bacterium]|nr:heavy metal-binding domain-containing protein [Bacillota bacterium]